MIYNAGLDKTMSDRTFVRWNCLSDKTFVTIEKCLHSDIFYHIVLMLIEIWSLWEKKINWVLMQQYT